MDNSLLPPRRPNVIRLTSLIDLLFVLLLFFMLTTSFIQEKQIELASPVASTEPVASKPQQLLLGVQGNLSLFGSNGALDDKDLDDKGLQKNLDAAHPVVLLPAPDADVQTIVSAMTHLTALGFKQLSLGKPYPITAKQGASKQGEVANVF